MSVNNTKKGERRVSNNSVSGVSGDKSSNVNARLTEIQATLAGICTRLDKYDTVFASPEYQTLEDLKADIYNEDGINARLDHTALQSEHNDTKIAELEHENQSLREELQLVKSVVIRMNSTMDDMNEQIIDLKRRSMRDNILIHNLEYSRHEDLTTEVPQKIKEHLDVDVEIVRVHRNGPQGSKKKPVSITAKLKDRDKKDELLKAQREKRDKQEKVPFNITAQEPMSLVENRKRLYELSDSLRSQKINSRVYRNNIIMPNGDAYTDEVQYVSNKDVLEVGPSDLNVLKSVQTEKSVSQDVDGNVFIAKGSIVENVEDVRRAYLSVCCDPETASADHRVLAYRFTDSHGKMHESYHDDSDHGTGRRILNIMRDNDISNAAMVVSRCRSKGARYINYERFQIIEHLVCEIADSLHTH